MAHNANQLLLKLNAFLHLIFSQALLRNIRGAANPVEQLTAGSKKIPPLSPEYQRKHHHSGAADNDIGSRFEKKALRSRYR